MTTTHTFQGLNIDSKPSSRVLNPPGGSSSNIFGCDDQPKQQASVKSKHEGISREKTDAVGHGDPAVTAGPQQKSWAPRSGDDSFHTHFGIYQSSGCDKAPGNNGVSSPVSGIQFPRNESGGRTYPRSKHSNADTFLNIFGDGSVQQRKMFRRIHNSSDDSFSRVFGQRSLLDSKEFFREIAPNTSALPASTNAESYGCNLKTGAASDGAINVSHSNSCNTAPKPDRVDDESKDFLFDKVFCRNASLRKTVPLSRRYSPKSVFNPITGEPYEQPKSKQEPLLPVVIHSESRTIADSCSAAELNQVTGSLATADHGKPQPIASTSAHLKQHQSGLFGGGAENVKEHRSTRVSQPPGGRSTKLW